MYNAPDCAQTMTCVFLLARGRALIDSSVPLQPPVMKGDGRGVKGDGRGVKGDGRGVKGDGRGVIGARSTRGSSDCHTRWHGPVSVHYMGTWFCRASCKEF